MLDIMTASDDSDVEGGIDRRLGDEDLQDNHWSQAPVACRRDILFVSHGQTQLLLP